MKFKNNLVFFTIFVFLIVISSGIVFAEDSNPAIPQIETGEVSGDVDILLLRLLVMSLFTQFLKT